MEAPEHIRIYCDSLSGLGYGCPIYEPDPGRFDPVQIGDVGYIEPYTGHFLRIFNAFYDAQSTINRFGLPDGFEPLAQDFQDCNRGADLPSGVHCMHIKVDKLVGFDIEGKVIPAGAELELSSSRRQGALIILKEPAQRVNSACREILAHALEENHRSWLEFVRRRSPKLDLQKMVLVTGYDLASDWATATVNESNTNVKIHFKIGDAVAQSVSASASVWGSWEYSSNVPVRFGPSAFQRQQHLETDTGKNQCIFLRAFRMVRRGFKLKAAAGPHILPSVDDDKDDSTSAMLMNIEDDSEEDLIYECSDVYDKVFNYLLERTNKEFVLLHDDDVPSILEDIISTEKDASVATHSMDTLLSYASGNLNLKDSTQTAIANSPAGSLFPMKSEAPLEEWESWDEALFEANVTQGTKGNRTDQTKQNVISSSSASPKMQSTTQRQASTASAKEQEEMGQDPYYANDRYSSAASARPLSIQKKSTMQSSKERPSWYNKAQLGGGSSYGQTSQPTRARRAFPTPAQPQQQTIQRIIPEEPEKDHSLPTPPLAPIGESLDAPAYERYPGEAQRRPSGTGVVLSYTSEDLSASPPPLPLRTLVTPVQELSMRRPDTPPRMNASPDPYQHQYESHLRALSQAKPRRRRPATPPRMNASPNPYQHILYESPRRLLRQAQPQSTPPMVGQQFVPPPQRMDFNPSVAYETSRPSIFDQLPMETLKRGEGSAALYNSAVAANMTSTPVKSRQPVSSPHRGYAGSVASTVSDYSIKSTYQPQNQVQPNYLLQQFYGAQDFNSSRAPFFPQVPVNPIPQYPSQIQAPYPERPMSSMSSSSQEE